MYWKMKRVINMNWSNLHKEMYACNKCTRYQTRQINSCFFGFGNLNANLLLCGEGPGFQKRVLDCMTFSSNRSGDFLLDIMARNKLHFGNSYLTNVVKCQKKDNEKPSVSEINICHHFLDEEVKLVKPLLIVCIGGVALQYFTKTTSVSQFIGKYTTRKDGIVVTAIYHPAYILRKGGEKMTSPFYKDYDKSFKFIIKLLDYLKKKKVNKKSNVEHWLE